MSTAPPVPKIHWLVWALSCWATAVVLTFAGMVAHYHVGPITAKTEPRAVAGAQFELVRGAGRVEGGTLIVERFAEDGTMIASAALNPPIQASEYRFAQVRVAGAFPRDGMALVWRTEKAGEKVPRLPVLSSGGRILPIPLTALDGWNGRIVGVGIVGRGELAGPLFVDRIEFRPPSIWTTIDGMVSDWVEFEPWDGGSIHFMAGGNPSLDHPLPLYLGLSFLVAVGLYLLVILLGHARFEPQAVLAIALLGWAVVDARWQLNLWKQLDITRHQYAGKEWEDKRRAAEDGRLFEFMRQAKAKIGKAPAHVFVYADEEFDRVRGAYHLYPVNVTVQPKRKALLPAETYKAGDVLVLYRKRGIEYSAVEKRLRWDGTQSLAADLMFFSEGSAVFRVLGPG